MSDGLRPADSVHHALGRIEQGLAALTARVDANGTQDSARHERAMAAAEKAQEIANGIRTDLAFFLWLNKYATRLGFALLTVALIIKGDLSLASLKDVFRAFW